jgi:hypothetical protein
MDAITRKAKETAREATERSEASATNAAEGLHACQAVILAATQANISAMLEYMQAAFSAKSVPELMEISTKYAHRQMQMMIEQGREITSAMQKASVGSVQSARQPYRHVRPNELTAQTRDGREGRRPCTHQFGTKQRIAVEFPAIRSCP